MSKMFKINDASQKCGDVVQHAEQFLPFAHKKMGFNKPVSINLISDPENAKNPLGKTAYYDPNTLKVTVFIDQRHLKDIMRSLAHELVHHTQNCRGDLEGDNYTGPGYAQKDKHMRKMEGEAYLLGNLCFRDWEDSLKGKTAMAENKNLNEMDYFTPAHLEKLKKQKEIKKQKERAEKARKEREAALIKSKEAAADAESDARDVDPGSSLWSDFKNAYGLEEKKTMAKKQEELEEGGAAARTGNEDRDAGRGRMSADRVHENEELEEGEEVVEESDAERRDKWTINIDGKDHIVKCNQCTKVEATSQAQAKIARRERGRPAREKHAREKHGQKDKNENWTRGNKDQLLFERLLKKWAK